MLNIELNKKELLFQNPARDRLARSTFDNWTDSTTTKKGKLELKYLNIINHKLELVSESKTLCLYISSEFLRNRTNS